MGLIKPAAKVAFASSVHGRVQRRQQARWAQQDQLAPQVVPQAAPVFTPPPVAALVAGVTMEAKLAQLTQLSELRNAGILTNAEFEAKKTLILAG